MESFFSTRCHHFDTSRYCPCRSKVSSGVSRMAQSHIPQLAGHSTATQQWPGAVQKCSKGGTPFRTRALTHACNPAHQPTQAQPTPHSSVQSPPWHHSHHPASTHVRTCERPLTRKILHAVIPIKSANVKPPKGQRVGPRGRGGIAPLPICWGQGKEPHRSRVRPNTTSL